MTPLQFKDWRNKMGFSQATAALALGLSRSSVENYEAGARREDNRPVVIPRTVALACAALFHRLPAWGEHVPFDVFVDSPNSAARAGGGLSGKR